MTDQQALEVIERICGDDFCEDMSMQDLDRQPDLKTAIGKLSRIYRISHALGQSHSCFLSHQDWRDEAEKTYAAIVEGESHEKAEANTSESA